MRTFHIRFAALLACTVAISACQTKTDSTLKSATEAGNTKEATTAEADADPADSAGTEAEKTAGAQPADKKTVEPAVAEAETGKAATDANVILAYKPPSKGTVLTFRNNWASLPPVITYRVDGIVTMGNTKYLKMTAIRGMGEKIAAYYDAKNYALKGYRDEKNKAVVTYKPMDERYRFPLKPGDRWVSAWKSYDHRQEKEFKGGGVISAIKFEELKLPSGTFRTMKVKLPSPPDMPKGMTHYVWFAPELGITVKEQIGNGTMNWTQILEKVERPSSGS